jgi:hypothetical protein
MADYAPTAANVFASSGAGILLGTVGAAVTQCQPVYNDPADGLWKLADANVASPVYKATGLTLAAAAANQPCPIATSDTAFDPGFALPAGEVVILSANPGKLCPAADLASGWFTTVIGVGIGSNKMQLIFKRSDVAKP